MNLEAIKAAATSKAAIAIFQGKKYSPQILFGAGVVGFGATVFLSIRATNKVSEKVDRAAAAKATAEKPFRKYNTSASADEIERDVRNIKLALAADIAKTYALPIAVGLVTLGCFGGAHYILNKRNGVLLAAYAGLDRAYSEYRKRVTDEVGEEREKELYFGVEEQEVSEKMADGTTKVTVAKGVPKKNGLSPYAVLFDEGTSRHFTREPGMNSHILEIKRSQCNDRLQGNGHIFLNEVYDILGMPRTNAGAIVGWIYDPNRQRPDANEVKRDSFVTFSLWDRTTEEIDNLDWHDPFGIFLDFNVDGVIWDRI